MEGFTRTIRGSYDAAAFFVALGSACGADMRSPTAAGEPVGASARAARFCVHQHAGRTVLS
jgi:hypothetical protein